MDGLLTAQGKYAPRKPRKTAYYHLVENHFEQLESEWDELYQPKYGFWREHVMDVIYRYLDCGDPKHGFARVKCQDCNHEYILPFSCKRRLFCPSCHQKRTIEFGEHLHDEVLEEVHHRQWSGRKQACCSTMHPGCFQFPSVFAHILCMTEN